MSRSRLCLAILLASIHILACSTSAFAWTHGQFWATTDACAGCHIAHPAQAPNLLKAGPTADPVLLPLSRRRRHKRAPYDAEDGYTQATGSAVYASTAGGFVKQFVDADSDGVIDAGELKDVTSRHNVWGFV